MSTRYTSKFIANNNYMERIDRHFSFLAKERNRIFEAMREWENKTCIRFYERPEDHNESYINIFKGAG